MPVSPQVLKKYPNLVFVETGTHLGDGVQAALDAECFPTIETIECYDPSYNASKKRFERIDRVTVNRGSSSRKLGEVISKYTVPITFWLDAHCSGPGTGMFEVFNPIESELKQIKEHLIKNHVILIDDIRLCGKEDFCGITLDQLKKMILDINPTYRFSMEDGYISDDILVCIAE